MTHRRQRARAPRNNSPHLLESLESRLLLTTSSVTVLVAANPTLTAFVVSADLKLLSGNVTFTDTTTSTTLGTVNLHLAATGHVDVFTATLTAPLTAGTHAFTATYNGDTTHAASHGNRTIAIGAYTILALGAGAGQHGIIHVFDVKTGALRAFAPFGNVNVALNVAAGIHDGIPIVAVAPGVGGGAFVKFINALTGAQVGNILVPPTVPSSYRGGLNIALGDVNGDGAQDVIIGQETGGDSIIEYNGADNAHFAQLVDIQDAFAAGYTGGVRIAVGDTNADGSADVAAVTASGAAVVTLFNADTSTKIFTKNFGPGYTGGGYVAVGDILGNGNAAIAVTYGNHALPIVQIFNPPNTALRFAFLAYPSSFTNAGGTYGTTIDLNGDGKADIVTNLGNTTRLHFVNGADATHFTALENAFANFNASLPISSISGFNELVA